MVPNRTENEGCASNQGVSIYELVCAHMPFGD